MAASPLTLPVAPGRPTRLFVALGLVYLIWSSTYFALRVVVTELPLIAGAVVLLVRGRASP